MTTADATLTTIGGRPVLRLERRLAHPPEKVWRAITDPDELAHWFPTKVETDLVPGSAIRFVMTEPIAEVTIGEVLEVDPPRLLAYRWDDAVLRWEIVPDGAGSRLVFTQTVSGGGDGSWGDRTMAAQHAAGWDDCLDRMDARLSGTEPPAEQWVRRNEAYVEKFGLAQGAIADGGRTLRFVRALVQPADEVWSVLTGGADVVVGGPPPIATTTPAVAHGNVTAVESPRWLEFSWLLDGEYAGTVGWELVPLPFGCKLILTQVVPAAAAGAAQAPMLAAWQVHLEQLVARLHGESRPWPAERVEELEAVYATRLAEIRTPAG